MVLTKIQESHYNILVEYYTYFYQKVHGRLEKNRDFSKYRLKPSKNQHKYIFDFLERNIHNLDSYGKFYYYNYFTHQFSYWASSEKIKKLRINVNWILDTKAQERWQKRDPNSDFYWNDFRISFSIKRKDLIPDSLIEEKSLNPNTKNIRKKYHNTDVGLGYCVMNNLLFDNKTILCIKCLYNKECKKLKESYAGTEIKQ